MKGWKLDDFLAALQSFSKIEADDSAKARKQKRILDAATELFEKFGYRKTSIDDVARAAGVAKGTVYLYFKTKAELMVQAIIAEKQRNMQAMIPVLEESDPVQRLIKWVSLGMTFADKMPITAMMSEAEAEMHEVLESMDENERKRGEEFNQAFISALIRDTAAGKLLSAEQVHQRSVVLQQVFISSTKMARGGVVDMSVDQFADVFSQMIVNGVLATPTKG